MLSCCSKGIKRKTNTGPRDWKGKGSWHHLTPRPSTMASCNRRSVPASNGSQAAREAAIHG
ncbi:hypothetical protein SESBI_15134 [Sesbania bispinosa]|nr:hypothetical protein SESBI_15134 [Sesbania bispinosa]